MKITLLQDESVIPTIAKWNQDFWAKWLPEGSSKEGILFYKKCMISAHLPFSFVAYENETVIGTIAVIEAPTAVFLANFFVIEEKRKLGLGRALVKSALEEANKRGIHEVYTWTDNLKEWYQSLGFQITNETEHYGVPVAVLKITTDKGE